MSALVPPLRKIRRINSGRSNRAYLWLAFDIALGFGVEGYPDPIREWLPWPDVLLHAILPYITVFYGSLKLKEASHKVRRIRFDLMAAFPASHDNSNTGGGRVAKVIGRPKGERSALSG